MNAKRLLTNLAVFLLSGFIIVYIIIQLVTNLTSDVEYAYAANTIVEKTIEKEGYIVRNETVLYAASEGVVTYSVREAEKVAADQLIANVFSSSYGVDIQNRLQTINDKIEILEKSAVDTSYLTSDVGKLDNKIYNSLVQMKLALADHRVSLTSQYKETLLINFNKRQLITNSAKGFSDRIDALQSEKENLTQSLQNPLATVYAGKAGYFTTLLDGYENVFTTGAVESLTVDSFRKLLETPPAEYSAGAIGKVITDFDWYTVCEVSREEAEAFTVGKQYSLTFLNSSREKLGGFLDKKVAQTDTDSVILVFRIEEVPQDFDYTRKQTIRISETSYEGLAIPKSALRVIDGVQGVYILSGNQVEFRKVDIIYTNDMQYICQSYLPTDWDHEGYLSLHDRVITAGKDLYEGKIID